MAIKYPNFSGQASSSLYDSVSKPIEGALGRVFSMDNRGEIVVPSAVNDNYMFYNDLYNVFCSIEDNNIMQALENKKLSEKSLRQLRNIVEQIIYKADEEYEELFGFQYEFLNNFATKSNTCYKKAKDLLQRSSGTIKKSMVLFKRFTKRIRNSQERRKVAGFGDEWTINHSYLTMPTTQSHFDFDDVLSPLANSLIERINHLMKMLSKLMKLCLETLEKEVNILNNHEQLECIYYRQFKSLSLQANYLIPSVRDFSIDKMSEQKDKLPWDEFLRKTYHIFDEIAMNAHVVYQLFMEKKKKNNNNDFEKTYLLNNDTKRRAIKRVINQIDEISQKGRENKFPSLYLAAFFYWSNLGCDKKEFYDYFWKKYKGKYSKFTYSTFVGACTSIDKNSPKYLEIAKKLDEIGSCF